MLATAIIALREFFEAFLIVGMFLGLSKSLHLKKELEILLAAAIGIGASFLLAIGTYFFSNSARGILTEQRADFLESYLLVFSGLFIAYVVFSLHGALNRNRTQMLAEAKKNFQEKAFDVSLFLLIAFLILREGFEIALFTASVSLLSTFIQNLLGLFMGFAAAAALGASTFFAFIKLPIQKVFKATEYLAILLGASLMQEGILKLLETHFSITIPGAAPLMLARLGIMLAYGALVYVLFMGRTTKALQR